jgi:GNAT superfamily N-acetyltransferase
LSNVVIRRATIEDQAAVEALAKVSLPVIRDMKYVWRRFKGWDSSPPYVAEINGEIVGFHAVQFLKKSYVNSYYLCVSKEHKGKGIGGALLEAVLEEANNRGLTRYTNKAATSNEGVLFYRGFGINEFCVSKRFPDGHVEYLFDFNIAGIRTIPQLIAAVQSKELFTSPDTKRLNMYTKKYEYPLQEESCQ